MVVEFIQPTYKGIVDVFTGKVVTVGSATCFTENEEFSIFNINGFEEMESTEG